MSLLKKFFVLVVLMFSLVLVACNKDEKTTTTTTTTESGTTTTDNGSTTTTEQTTTTTEQAAPTVIRVGTWWQPGYDPTYIDPALEDYNDSDMPLALRQAKLDALDTVLEELNVQIEWVEYSTDLRQEILQTVLAGDPVADIVGMWGGSQGTVLAQNVLQDLTDYRDDFGTEAFWMLGSMDMFGKTMGFAHEPSAGFPFWPLVYNISYLENCDTLINGGYADEEGNVVLPSQLWDEGTWNWATFKDYLTKVKACTTDVGLIGGNRGRVVHAYEEDYRYAAMSLSAANGEFVVRPDGSLGIDTEASIEVIEFLQDLKREELMFTETYEGITPGWLWNNWNFGGAETVFTSMANWNMEYAVNALTERGDELGMVPFPIGPKAEADPENYPYHTPYLGGNSMGIPKGVSPEKTELAIKAWALYNKETFKNLGYENTQEYIDAENAQTSAKFFPVTNPVYGDSLKNSYNDWVNSATLFDPASMLGIFDPTYVSMVAEIIADPNKDAATEVAQQKPNFDTAVSDLQTVLSGDDIVDNQAPVVKQLPDTELIFEINTDLTQLDWSTYFEAYDIGLDVELTLADVTFDYTGIDNTQPNTTSVLNATVTDADGNEYDGDFTVYYYDPQETVDPIIALNSQDDINFEIDYDLSSVDWTQYVTVTDQLALADGTILVDGDGNELTFDLNGYLSVDISFVDVSTPDIYIVTLTVTDFAGNTTSLDIDVNVLEPSN